MAPIAPTPYRYWAFISYSNKDQSIARWLHRAIETYGIPAPLTRHPTPTGDPAPQHFRPIFRDRAELPAAPSLGAEIQEALSASRYLIVVCSPSSAGSRWVSREIEAFHAMGRHDRVLAVVVDGIPNAGDDRECLPACLRRPEAVTADAQPEGDGRMNAKLKLLARMLGVSFDALRERDAGRRMRRLRTGIALATAVAVGFAGLSVYAVWQRDKAVEAREQAEGILQYLAFEFPDELEPIGWLDVAHSMQERIGAYYLSQGDRSMAQGDLDDGLRELQAGVAVMEQLSSSDPGNPVWQQGLFVGYYKLAVILDIVQDPRALEWSTRAYEQLVSMKQRGIMESSDERILRELEARVGG